MYLLMQKHSGRRVQKDEINTFYVRRACVQSLVKATGIYVESFLKGSVWVTSGVRFSDAERDRTETLRPRETGGERERRREERKYSLLGVKHDGWSDGGERKKREREMVLSGLAHWHTTMSLHARVCVFDKAPRANVITFPCLCKTAKCHQLLCQFTQIQYPTVLYTVYAVCKHTTDGMIYTVRLYYG